jgi:hypothetical protein
VPLTEAVTLKACLQKGNRIQVPKPVRWQFRLETSQVLRVTMHPLDVRLSWEDFYGRMDKSGRITVPKLTMKLMENEIKDNQSLTGTIIEITIEPA